MVPAIPTTLVLSHCMKRLNTHTRIHVELRTTDCERAAPHQCPLESVSLATSAIYADVSALALFHVSPSLPGTSEGGQHGAAARPGGHLTINLGSTSTAATELPDDSVHI